MDVILANASNSFGVVGNKKDIKGNQINAGHRKINSYNAGIPG
jgi:hypothetical protein